MRALAVMVKAPVPGLVKTRLVPPLTFDEAAGLYRCFVKDTFDSIKGLDGVRLYAPYAPPALGDEVASVIPAGVEAFPQEGHTLGERISNVFKRLFASGFKKVVVIGSDSPDIPLRYIEDAFKALGRASLVLGPAKDGGYYLVGMNVFDERPFQEIPWSTSKVLDETLKRAHSHHIPFELVSEWHDCDSFDDLALLRDNLSAPASSAFLKGLTLE